jgi:hypothetical protein
VATDLREGPARPSLRKALKFERHELPALLGVLGFVTLLHVLGWGLFIYYNSQPSFHRLTDSHGALIYAGAGALAYGFGLRHAFDADHISAIDDTTRLMLAKGKKPLGVGLFFSLGHSSIVPLQSRLLRKRQSSFSIPTQTSVARLARVSPVSSCTWLGFSTSSFWSGSLRFGARPKAVNFRMSTLSKCSTTEA